MINLKEFKQSVLQKAMQGKLTKQLPSDGNARDLLIKIANKKRDLVQAGKLKYHKPLSPITDKEIPYNIPDNWQWARLNNISLWQSGGYTPKKSIKSNYDGNIPWVKGGDLNDNYINNTTVTISPRAIKRYSLKLHKKGSIIIARAGNVSKLGILNVTATYNDQCFSCASYIHDNKFIFYYLLYSRNNLLALSSGSAQHSLAITKLRNYLIPLPPLSEQKRIVAKVHKCFELSDAIQKERELNKKFAHDMKQSLLMEAMQGKLTKQLPSDGNADELLQKIQQKKQELVKAGKIHRHKKLPPINKDEIPSNFTIPKNWKWTRLSIILDVRDGTHSSPKKLLNGIPLITSKNIKNHHINFHKVNYISKTDAEKISKRSKVNKYDIVMPMIGTVGNPAINISNKVFSIKNVALIKHNKFINIRFIYDYLLYLSPYLQKNSSGAVQSFISLTKIRNIIVPLPPLSEQKRIVSILNKLFSQL